MVQLPVLYPGSELELQRSKDPKRSKRTKDGRADEKMEGFVLFRKGREQLGEVYMWL